ncbi:MAG: argininosuccinate lyase, partial [Eubacteriales bacterium]|nr:argininosuccinate lyase [Eubacteriales bacterium]
GSGALAGTTFPIDREAVAAELGFEKITSNSLDGVSDRDFVIEMLSCISIIMMHLSRFCEELVLWSSSEFGFAAMDDSFSTGSSIMPQKKNPDMAELIRGKTGRAYGSLITVLTVMKSLPLAYNKDMQEDKEAVFDAVDTMLNCLGVFTGMLASAKFNKDKMYTAAREGYANATDAADYLAAKGLPFREAHEIAGKMVLYCISSGKPLDSLTDSELAGFSSLFGSDTREKLSLRCCIDSRNTPGGPSPGSVQLQIKEAQRFIDTILRGQPQT